MTTPTSLIMSDANRRFDVIDSIGRKLAIRRINALDRLRLLKAAGPELSQNDAWLDVAALAISVVEIDGVPRTIATNERQIEAMVSELGDSGLQSVAEALGGNDEGSALFNGPPEGNAVGTPT